MAVFAVRVPALRVVDIVVNSAGFTSRRAARSSVDDWDRLHAVLVRGSFLVSREAAG